MDSYIRLSIIYDIKKWQGQLLSLMASRESVKVFFEWQTLKESKLVQFDKMYK
jgi:hypothetical protein